MVLIGLAFADASGLDEFFFPEYLQKKISNQIKKSYKVSEFQTMPVEMDSMVFDYDFMEIVDGNSDKVGYGIVTLANGCKQTAKSWLKQFVGRKGGDLKVDRQIDGISGATISVHSIVKEINKQQVLLSDQSILAENN